jgi:nucleoside-diphosphate-sugar epimerase
MSDNSRKQTVLITGANGFVGSWATKIYAAHGYSVVALVRPNRDLSKLTGVVHRIEIADESLWPQVIARTKPEIVILGDWSGVAGKSKNDESQFENVVRWEGLANASRLAATRLLIAFGSQAELGLAQLEATESSSMKPVTKYGLAKVQALHSLNMILKDSHTKFCWVRVFSVYGPDIVGDWVIPQTILAIREKREISLTSCEQEWNFLHVSDLIELLLIISQLENPPGIIHAAAYESLPLKTYLTTLGELANGTEFLVFGRDNLEFGEPLSLRPNTDLAKSIGWEPKVTWRNGITEVLNSTFPKNK